jgi:hypothetical protein
MMRRPIARATAAAAAMFAAHMGAASASAAPVNRPLADELTRQFNQKELEQLQSGDASAYSQPGADQLNRHQLGEPGAIPPPAGMPPPQPGGSYPPR